MPLSADRASEIIHDALWPAWKAERERLDRIDRWYRGEHEIPALPQSATTEHKRLIELIRTPWLRLVVSTTAQALYVDGYRSPEQRDNARSWDAWQRNDFDGRQMAVHRAALAYGYAFVTALPGLSGGESAAVMRGVSPRKLYAAYADPAEDDFPVYAIRIDEPRSGKRLVRLYDDTSVYRFTTDTGGDAFEPLSVQTHDLGFCPIVRYTNMLDLDGRPDGEVEPFIPNALRIDKTVYDRMLVQHFNSWKVRTVAGLAEPDSEEEANRKKLKLRQDDILIAEDPDTKFGTLPETPLDGIVRATEADIKSLAAASQTPTHALTGDLINLNAEALAAARAEHYAKVIERQATFGRSHDLLLRTVAQIEGDTAGAEDFEAHVTWQDMSVRSLAAAVDALGKAAQMLGIPPRALWSRIPGVTKLDVDEWISLADQAAQGDGIAQLAAALTTNAEQQSSSFAPVPAPAANGATPPPAG